MSKVDVDIYLNNLRRFFEKNPKDLINLIGDVDKDIFFEKVGEVAEKNIQGGKEVELTQQQFIDILLVLHKKKVEKQVSPHSDLFIKTKYSNFCLN